MKSLDKAAVYWLKTSVNQGILLTDDSMVVRGWNKWLQIYSGKPADEVIGKPLFDIFPDIVQRDLDELYRKAIRGQISVLDPMTHKYLIFFPLSWKGSSSGFMLQRVHITPLYDESHKVIGTLTAIEDVTELVNRENALILEKEKIQNYLNIAGVINLVLDIEGRVEFINSKGCQILGLSEKQILGRPWFENFIPERDREDILDNFQAVMTEEDLLWSYVENAVITASGKERLIAWNNILLRDETGKISGTLSSGVDITFRKELEEEIIRGRDDWESTFNSVQDLIAVIDRQHRIVKLNKAMADRLGVTTVQAVGLKCHEAVHGTRQPPDFCPHQALLMDHTAHKEDVFEPRLGGHFQVTVTPRYDRNGKVVGSVHVAHDINVRKKSEETVRALSLTDELTGLYNRRGFVTLSEQQLKTALRMNTAAALIFADLDGMKEINDTFGHKEGDNALVATARILKQVFRSSDIIARMGGDEFVVFAMESEGFNVCVITQRLAAALDNLNAAGSNPFNLSLSTGIVRLDPRNPESSSLDDLISQADAIMYENKQKKKQNNPAPSLHLQPY